MIAGRAGITEVFKRFVIGYVLGITVMYWYLNNGEEVLAGWDYWFQDSASNYRGDSKHRAIDRQTR